MVKKSSEVPKCVLMVEFGSYVGTKVGCMNVYNDIMSARKQTE